ncbi:class I SAM-dependent DNA methyltransferase [Sphingomonas qilianensis]|uniref:site-specific DNA-methyltransferase (adenine-specific) n=1 Tax=Sphingomonas qilianensis TaxID=1736690 RepID=A0ABU9XT04_9SPHN
MSRFAVDGALHYAKHLSKAFNVIAVGVSGQTSAELIISTYLHTRDAEKPKRLTTKGGTPVDDLIPWPDYIEHATFDPAVQSVRQADLMAFSRELHDFMRSDIKASESEKPLFVSGTLIALRNKIFAKTFNDYTPDKLPAAWLSAIKTELSEAELPKSKLLTVVLPYTAIAAHPELPKPNKRYPRGVLNELITRLNDKVWPFISVYHDFDVVGQFYGEFLKYTGGDKKALGIVLTPRHITELFALLANVNKDSKVLDPCAGTGGFLIAAMHQMFKTAITESEKESIKKNGLIGVEQQPNMYALAASNMLLRGDGKANLHQASFFEPDILKEIKLRNCDVGLINPPYSQDDEELHELYFVLKMLECLTPGATGIAIIPINCAISPHKARAELLRLHTLEAVMSLPVDLFAPVGVIACVMVFTAHKPHSVSKKKTWFGYWSDDGYVRTKHLGRIDQNRTWNDTRDHWVETFRNREIIQGYSVSRKVTDADEWCAEAYMQTDYTTITPKDFEKEVRNYLAFKITHGDLQEDAV